MQSNLIKSALLRYNQQQRIADPYFIFAEIIFSEMGYKFRQVFANSFECVDVFEHIHDLVLFMAGATIAD